MGATNSKRVARAGQTARASPPPVEGTRHCAVG
jgi:hypothetical protein